MVKTIGNPLSWAAQGVIGGGRAMSMAAGAIRSPVNRIPDTCPLTIRHVSEALRKGVRDFLRFRSDVIFLVLIYPIIGIALALIVFNRQWLQMIFPLGAGFLLLGPIAAIGLYEMSRQAETGAQVGWGAALSVLRARIIAPVLVMALYLLALFLLWIAAAFQIHAITLGAAPESLAGFLRDVLTTPAGWAMTALGLGVGLVFAVIVLVTSLFSLPMLLDRRAGLPVAVATSVAVAARNPVTVALWGLIVAVLMLLGSLPGFLGLVVVLPVLGHATWHLYRAALPA